MNGHGPGQTAGKVAGRFESRRIRRGQLVGQVRVLDGNAKLIIVAVPVDHGVTVALQEKVDKELATRSRAGNRDGHTISIDALDKLGLFAGNVLF